MLLCERYPKYVVPLRMSHDSHGRVFRCERGGEWVYTVGNMAEFDGTVGLPRRGKFPFATDPYRAIRGELDVWACANSISGEHGRCADSGCEQKLRSVVRLAADENA